MNDPAEHVNRSIYDFNVTVDRALIRPVARGYGQVIPAPVRTGISNVASNLDQPLNVVNNVLQLRFDDALRNSFRFLVNSTIGLGGLLDPSSGIGLYAEDTDFGETLHVWGVSEGGFVMLPVLGPSTSRDTVGTIVDTAMNPLHYVLESPESDWATGANVADAVNSRYELGDEIDRLYYDSADGYAQLRLIYLSNRRYDLRQGTGQDATYSDPYADPYSDPYEDPYAQ